MDPVTILCSILTIADASKKVYDRCSYYISHVKNAPKELQHINENLRGLDKTLKKLHGLRSAQPMIDHVQIPLSRIKDSVDRIADCISRLDMKVGIFHEMAFRSRWARSWRTIEQLVRVIVEEKAELHLATSMQGTEMFGIVFDIVKEHLPREALMDPCITTGRSNEVWEKVEGKRCPPDQAYDFIIHRLGDLIHWNDAIYKYPYYDDLHKIHLNRSEDYPKEPFLESVVYQAWKGRKTRGPAVLCISGAPSTGKSILCSRMIQDLQRSNDEQIGVADFHSRHRYDDVIEALRIWIIRLALQCRCLPILSDAGSPILKELIDLPPFPTKFVQKPSSPQWKAHMEGLLSILKSLLPMFRRTFLLIDGIEDLPGREGNGPPANEVVELLQNILEQHHGDVSIATFTRVPPAPLLQIADVSIRLAHVEPNLETYTSFLIHTKVKPALRDANPSYNEDLLAEIESTIIEAAHGLYLGVDVLIDSLVAVIHEKEDIERFLRRTREGNEIMLQRDPESMKQKAFGVDTLTPHERPAKRNMARSAPAAESSRES
ncbi:MAG: hypothetical protein Q9220_004335 [cf. Caloplaca sp. 1 TL-2023]